MVVYTPIKCVPNVSPSKAYILIEGEDKARTYLFQESHHPPGALQGLKHKQNILLSTTLTQLLYKVQVYQFLGTKP